MRPRATSAATGGEAAGTGRRAARVPTSLRLPALVVGSLPVPLALAVAAVAGGVFHLAYQPGCAWLMPVFLLGVWRLALGWRGSNRAAFYGGLALGLALDLPQLGFFWGIFGAAACSLWLILAFWTGLFFLLARGVQARLGLAGAVVALPFLWTGLEYFRGELYYLRFTWVTPGDALGSCAASSPLAGAGVYGYSFLVLALYSGLWLLSQRGWRWAALGFAALELAAVGQQVQRRLTLGGLATTLPVAGVQLEFPDQLQVLAALDKLLVRAPAAELIVLSEYTFDGPVPGHVRQWCRTHARYLIAGGKEWTPDGNFYNTAFVIGPGGQVAFQQAKAVPIQFFKDGRPAPTQRVWASPWGKLGLCICYDLSYARVVDRLIRQGAQALIVPTMDVAAWGPHEHALHARVGPVRAAEYGVPVFRVASSGVSQLVDAQGRVGASASYPGGGEMLFGELRLAGPGRLPLDRWLAPACSGATLLTAMGLAVAALAERRRGVAGSQSPVA